VLVAGHLREQSVTNRSRHSVRRAVLKARWLTPPPSTSLKRFAPVVGLLSALGL
jgi:hypothetical protein